MDYTSTSFFLLITKSLSLERQAEEATQVENKHRREIPIREKKNNTSRNFSFGFSILFTVCYTNYMQTSIGTIYFLESQKSQVICFGVNFFFLNTLIHQTNQIPSPLFPVFAQENTPSPSTSQKNRKTKKKKYILIYKFFFLL
jgi:hypothetical protein